MNRRAAMNLRIPVVALAAIAAVAVVVVLSRKPPGSIDAEPVPQRPRSALATTLLERFGPRQYCLYGSGTESIAKLLDPQTPALADATQLDEWLRSNRRSLVIVADPTTAPVVVADLHHRTTLEHEGRPLTVHEYTPELSDAPPALAGRIGPHVRQVNLLTTGDWGQETIAQAEVAASMSLYATRQKPAVDAVMLVGDNFYGPLGGTDDRAWQSLFESRFDRDLLPAPFYAILGNHDYEADKVAIQLRYATDRPGTRWRMPAKWYRVDLPPERPLVTALMLDSNARDLSPAEWAGQRRWLIEQLRTPRDGRWLAVFAHHPLFSRGMHGDDVWLQREWGELFAQHRVDLYVCGHDHDLQHLRVPERQTEFLVVGGGGAATRPIDRQGPGPFADGIHGFAHLRFGEEVMEGALVDQQGREVHMFSREKPRRP